MKSFSIFLCLVLLSSLVAAQAIPPPPPVPSMGDPQEPDALIFDQAKTFEEPRPQPGPAPITSLFSPATALKPSSLKPAHHSGFCSQYLIGTNNGK